MSDSIDDRIPNADLLGQPLSETESAIARVHLMLEDLYKRPDLAPCVQKNTLAALGLTWQMMNDLGIPTGMPEDLTA